MKMNIQFTNKDQDFKYIKRQILRNIAIICIIILAAMAIFCIKNDEGDTLTIVIYSSMGILISFWMFYSGLKKIKIQQEKFEKFLLTINPKSIQCDIPNSPTIVIGADEIGTIVEHTTGWIHIQNTSKTKTIAISPYIENRQQMIELLEKMKPMKHNKKSNMYEQQPLKITIAVLGISLVAFFIVFFSNNIFLTIPSAVLLIGIQIYTLTNSKLKNKTKGFRFTSILLIIILFFVVYIKHFIE